MNGVNIKEDTVTKQIMSLRESSYKSDEDWATYLSQQGLTPASYRENVILCTEQFNVTEVASVDEIPAGICDAIAERITSAKESEKYGAWLKDYTEKADIEIKKMPAEVPYNFDVDAGLSNDKSEDKAE